MTNARQGAHEAVLRELGATTSGAPVSLVPQHDITPVAESSAEEGE